MEEIHKAINRKVLVTFLVCLVLVLLAFGTGPNGFGFNFDSWTKHSRNIILFDIRLPRILVSAISGGALAVAGVLSQGLFRNPLAGPSIIGTVSGANLFVILLIFTGWAHEHWFAQPMAAFSGALLSTMLILYLANLKTLSSPGRLLLMGFALNAIFGAITTFLLSLSLHEYNLSQSIIYWLLGGFNGKGWDHVFMGLPWLIVGIIFAVIVSRKLDILNLGEDIAQTLAIPVNNLRTQVIIVISILVGASVAIAGGVAFVGLIAPHLTRLYLGASHRRLTFASFLNGISLVVFADTLARTLWAPQEVQVGAILALIGAPIFIFLLLFTSRKTNELL